MTCFSMDYAKDATFGPARKERISFANSSIIGMRRDLLAYCFITWKFRRAYSPVIGQVCGIFSGQSHEELYCAAHDTAVIYDLL